MVHSGMESERNKRCGHCACQYPVRYPFCPECGGTEEEGDPPQEGVQEDLWSRGGVFRLVVASFLVLLVAFVAVDMGLPIGGLRLAVMVCFFLGVVGVPLVVLWRGSR